MLDGDLKWLIGIAISIETAILTIAVGGFWKILGMIKAVEKDSEEENKVLHARINKLNERVVQKEDLDNHLTRVEGMIAEVRREQRENAAQVTDRLDRIIGQINHN